MRYLAFASTDHMVLLVDDLSLHKVASGSLRAVNLTSQEEDGNMELQRKEDRHQTLEKPMFSFDLNAPIRTVSGHTCDCWKNMAELLSDSSIDIDYCTLPGRLGQSAGLCAYVLTNSDACEGSGYLLWTAIVVCEQSASSMAGLIAAAVLLTLFLFFCLAVAADDFFSPNVTGIVKVFNINPAIAGVTFLAFGNGAPDVLTSLASVVGASTPKPGLAIGALIGAGIFVSTIVAGSVVLVRPFLVMRRPIMRDLGFYSIALIWTGVSITVTDTLYWWQPAGLLVLYAIYAITVVSGRYFWQWQQNRPGSPVTESTSSDDEMKEEEKYDVFESTTGNMSNAKQKNNKNGQQLENGCAIVEVDIDNRDGCISSSVSSSPVSEITTITITTVTEIVDDKCNQIETNGCQAKKMSGKFDSNLVKSLIRQVLCEFLFTVKPIDNEEWRESGTVGKVFMLIKAPVVFVFKLTVPLYDGRWCQILALFHCFICPLLLLFAFQVALKTPIHGGPPWFVFGLVLSVILSILMLILTDHRSIPKHYMRFSCLIGFVMATSWVYLIANEVVSTLTMFGVISRIDAQVIGLTVLAWSNSAGDLVSDIAVARKKVPRMAFTATIAGPLFNLLIGFGVPFLIAAVRAKEPINLEVTTVTKIMLIFLGLSLGTSLILLPVQKFFVRRSYAVCLFCIYLVFLLVVVLAAMRMFHF